VAGESSAWTHCSGAIYGSVPRRSRGVCPGCKRYATSKSTRTGIPPRKRILAGLISRWMYSWACRWTNAAQTCRLAFSASGIGSCRLGEASSSSYKDGPCKYSCTRNSFALQTTDFFGVGRELGQEDLTREGTEISRAPDLVQLGDAAGTQMPDHCEVAPDKSAKLQGKMGGKTSALPWQVRGCL
jgi:hypothetical protein